MGKTKIALEYANRSRQQFQATFWISADNSIKVSQGFIDIARRLRFTKNEEEADPVAAMDMVKNWVAEISEFCYPSRF